MRMLRHIQSIPWPVSLVLVLLLFVGCGSPQEGIVLKIDDKALVEAETFKIWVIRDKLKNGQATTCLALVENTNKDNSTFDATQFDAEQTQEVTISGEETPVNFKSLSLGAKLFVVAGFGKDAKDDKNPVALGCSQTNIEAGKKVFVSIFLAQVK